MDEEPRRYEPGAMRASDADRDAVLAELGEHFQAGRLTLEEFDERSDLALRARTHGELADLTSDLPAPRIPAPSAKPWSRHSGPRLPVAAIAATLALVVLVVATVTSDAAVGHAALRLWWLVLIVPLVASRAGRGRR
jgi:hypothetical protein